MVRRVLLDWQAVRRGHPSRELAYTLVHEHDHRPTAGPVNANSSTTTAWRWPTQAVPTSTAMSCGTATGKAPCTPYVRGADHRRDGRHAGREHRYGRTEAKCRRAG